MPVNLWKNVFSVAKPTADSFGPTDLTSTNFTNIVHKMNDSKKDTPIKNNFLFVFFI